MKCLITIVDRKKGPKVLKLYHRQGLDHNYVCMGKGTANSELLAYLGLAEIEKCVIFSLVEKENVPSLLKVIDEEIALSTNGTGVAFTISLKSISKKSLAYFRNSNGEEIK